MKTLLLPLLLAVAPAGAFACGPVTFPSDDASSGAVVAVEPIPAAEPVAAVEATPAQDALPADEAVAIHASDADAGGVERGCIRETGTRIDARDEDGCTGAPGESFDRDDIDRTGATDTADALRKLSPKVTIRH